MIHITRVNEVCVENLIDEGARANFHTMSAPRILLGVSGSIAAYKAPEIARQLTKRGASVQAALTEGARRFITPLTFQAVTGRPPLIDLFALGGGEIEHVERAHEVDLILVAPASANVIARLASGMANDVLTATALSTTAPLMIAPAMESGMWTHPATQENMERLLERGAHQVGPEDGGLASGRSGWGRMAEPALIAARAWRLIQAAKGLPWEGLRVLITAGPTWEPLDPVRLLTNRSSGAMGIALATRAAELGAQVKLVLGPTHLSPDPVWDDVLSVHRVESAHQMLDAAQAHVSKADVIIGTAAVSDYRPKDARTSKLKRSDPKAQVLELSENPDVLKSLSSQKKAGATVVGFAAETESLESHARGKMQRKGCDMVVGNIVGKDRGFGAGETSVVAVLEKEAKPFGPATKTDVAKFILDQVDRLRKQQGSNIDERES